MKHFPITAPECIGWLRLCRPGSVIGPQQNFLMDMEKRMQREGDAHRRKQQQGGAGDELNSQMRSCAVGNGASSPGAKGPSSPTRCGHPFPAPPL